MYNVIREKEYNYAVLTVYLTIIPLALVGYEVIDSQLGASRLVGYNHLISNKREWNNCFIKNHQQTLLDFADFAWLGQPEGNLIGHSEIQRRTGASFEL